MGGLFPGFRREVGKDRVIRTGTAGLRKIVEEKPHSFNGSWRSLIHSRHTGLAQNVHLDFPLISYRKTQMNFLANPIFIYCWALERRLKTDSVATPLKLV